MSGLENMLMKIGEKVSTSQVGQKSLAKTLRKMFEGTNYVMIDLSREDIPFDEMFITSDRTPNEVVKERVEKVKNYFEKELQKKQDRINELENLLAGQVVSDIKLLKDGKDS